MTQKDAQLIHRASTQAQDPTWCAPQALIVQSATSGEVVRIQIVLLSHNLLSGALIPHDAKHTPR